MEQNNVTSGRESKRKFNQLLEQQYKSSENTSVVELEVTDSTQFERPTITESTTTKRVFNLPIEIATQIRQDVQKQITLETSKLEYKYQEMFNQFLENFSQSQQHENNLEQKITSNMMEYLISTFKGKFVVITYDGKVIDSDISKIKIMKRMKEGDIPLEQVFLYDVPLK